MLVLSFHHSMMAVLGTLYWLIMAYPFHLVDCSPWPILMSLVMFSGAICVVSWMN